MTALEPGDVLLTSSHTPISRIIIFAQRICHFSFRKPGFSHAIVVISPMVTFDTVGDKGARFRRQIPDAISETEEGEIQLWLDISHVRNMAVMRYGSSMSIDALLMAATSENTSPYPKAIAFLNLFHPKIKSLWNKIKRRSNVLNPRDNGMFCSSLAAYLLKKVSLNDPFLNEDWSEMSPFKLYIPSCNHTSHTIKSAIPNNSCSESHQMLLQFAQLQLGANNLTNIDEFQHASEDLMKIYSNSSLINHSLEQDPNYFIELDGKRLSLIEFPHLTHVPDIKRQINGISEMLDDLKRMSGCYASCKIGCRNAAACLTVTELRYARMLEERAKNE